MKRLFIFMCQGRQSRLPDLLTPKQLVSCGGVPLLERTINYLRRVTTSDMLVVGPTHLGFLDICSRYDASLFTQDDPGLCVNVGVENSVRFWAGYDRVHVMLGDVIFSKDALDKTIDDDRDISFTCSSDISPGEGEIFAMSLKPDSMEGQYTTQALRAGYCRHTDTRLYQCGHLRRLLWLHCNSSKFAIKKRDREAPHVVFVDDYTRYIDYPEDLANLDSVPVL
jgi:hypothetical protein